MRRPRRREGAAGGQPLPSRVLVTVCDQNTPEVSKGRNALWNASQVACGSGSRELVRVQPLRDLLQRYRMGGAVVGTVRILSWYLN